MSTPTCPNSDIATKTVKEYAFFFTKMHVDKNLDFVDESIETVLTRLDELYGMLEMIRDDNGKVINELIPLVAAKIQSLDPVFQRIDKLEAFVEMVSQNVREYERQVSLKEKEFSSIASLKKTIGGFSFMGLRKKTDVPISPSPQRNYSPPPIFSTRDYFNTN